MEYPKFNSALLVTASSFLTLYLQEVFAKHFVNSKFSVTLVATANRDTRSDQEWLSPASLTNIYISNKFLKAFHLARNQERKFFFEKFKMFVKPSVRTQQEDKLESTDPLTLAIPFATLSVFYKTQSRMIFQFLFQITGDETVFAKAFNNVLDVIHAYNTKTDVDLRFRVKRVHSTNSRIKYFMFDGGKWNLLDPLVEMSNYFNVRYREGKDSRIKKPWAAVHMYDFRKYFVMESNWSLQFDNLATFMVKPNDMAIYSSLCSKQLKQASKFYEKRIIPRFMRYEGHFPSVEIQGEYFDYFEMIIAAVTFAFTTLEAFSNICIPQGYVHIDKKKGPMTKIDIEEKLSLAEKFRKVLPSILKSPDPSRESWWKKFERLRDLRNMIIHTKQSKSEVRYSLLLAKETLNDIAVHEEIIKYFATYIRRNKPDMLEELPYNFGYDEFQVKLVSDHEYHKITRTLRNPSR